MKYCRCYFTEALIFHILKALTWTRLCLILQGGKKQGLIHLNKRAVQPAMAALRTDSKEWDCISKEGHRETECRLWWKEEVYISDKSFCEQRHSKINKQYMCLICLALDQVRKILFTQAETVFKRDQKSAEQMGSIIVTVKERVAFGVCDSCVVTVSKLICSNSQWLLHFTQSTWLSHLRTLPPHGQWMEVPLFMLLLC